MFYLFRLTKTPNNVAAKQNLFNYISILLFYFKSGRILIYLSRQNRGALVPYGMRFVGLVQELPSVKVNLQHIDPYVLRVMTLLVHATWGK